MILAEKCKKIKLLLTDVDGVLTNGSITYDSKGNELKSFNVKDGYICKYLKKSGIELGIITGRESKVVEKRAEELGFKYLYQGASDKLLVLEELLGLTQLNSWEVAYIGDDLNDIDLLRNVGLSATPSDSFHYIKESADYICERSGGKAAFREFADLILKFR